MKKSGFPNTLTILIVLLFSIGSITYAEAQTCGDKSIVNKNNDGKVLASASATITLSDKPVLVSLKPVVLTDTSKETFLSKISAVAPESHIYLVLNDLRTNSQPGVLYHIYLNLPPESLNVKNNEFFVGSLNFFNATASPDDRFFSFDVTGLIRDLQTKKKLGDQATLTILPSGVPDADAKPLICSIKLLEQ